MKIGSNKNLWYAGGLNFECLECGRCCSGPNEGYIWITGTEIELIADYLKMPAGEVRKKYVRWIGFRKSIIENLLSKDCIFLENANGHKKCRIYPVRPNQCRAWPFWNSNLVNAKNWTYAAIKCPGLNRGKLHSIEEIEKIICREKWWEQ